MVAKREDAASESGAGERAPWREYWQDYYAALGVDREASGDEIRRAYEERASVLDPARFGEAPPTVLERARREFALVSRAYAVLSDAGLRQLYDEEFGRLASFRATRPASEAAPRTLVDAPAAAGRPRTAPEEVRRAREARSASAFESKPWGLPAILAVLIIPTLFWVSGFFVAVPEEQTTAEIALGLVTTIIFKDFLLIGLAAAFALWRYRLGWQSLGFQAFDRRRWWVPLAVVVAAYAGMLAYNAILVGAGVSEPEQEEVQSFFESKALLPLTFVTLVIMAPLSEEIYFRGFIFAGLVRLIGAAPAMIASGLLFGAFHVSGLETLPLLAPIGAIGAAFAWLYLRTGSLWFSMAAHALFNGVSFVAMALS